MLVVLSDLHLSDGTTARNVHASAFQLLCQEIVTAADSKDAKEVHVLLLGDILDLVRTSYWHTTTTQPPQRPWNGPLDPATGMNTNSKQNEAQFAAVLNGILKTSAAKEFVSTIDSLTAKTKRRLPTKLTYVIGNHDRVLNNFPSLQQTIRDAFHNVTAVTFDNVFRSEEYGVLGRHGHEWDENCHGWSFYNKVLRKKNQPTLDRFAKESYQVMAIGEVVTAELMSGLVYHAGKLAPANTSGYKEFMEGFKDINNIRPTLDVFPWLEWFARGQIKAYESALFKAMQLSLDGVLDSSLAHRWDDLVTDLLVQGDLTDRLSLLRKRILGGSFNEFRSRVSTISKLQELKDKLTPDKDEYVAGAESEQEWKGWDSKTPGPIQFVLYGHTHLATHVAFAASLDHRVRMYINTGTILPLIARTTTGEGFATAMQMTMAFFFREDEDQEDRFDRGPTLDLWNGIRRKVYVEPKDPPGGGP